MELRTDGGVDHLDWGGSVQTHWLGIIPGRGFVPHYSAPKVTPADCVIPTRHTHQDN